MTDERLRQFTEKLLKARTDGPLTGETPATGPADLKEAYDIQRLVTARLGPVGAFKTGRKSPGDQPIIAPILASMVRPSPAWFGAGELVLIGIELEVAFLVHRALPDPGDPRFEERARTCVSPLAAIEIIDSRLAEFEAAGAMWKLADNQVNGGFVHGEPVHDWDHIDLETLHAKLEIGESPIFAGPSVVSGGNAFEGFCAFARAVGDHCGGILPGQYVTTGTLTGMHFAEPGQRVTGRIAGLGEVSVEFAPG